MRHYSTINSGFGEVYAGAATEGGGKSVPNQMPQSIYKAIPYGRSSPAGYVIVSTE